MLRLIIFASVTLATSAFAGSIGTPSGCKKLKGSAQAACLQCVATQNFYQPDGSCGAGEGMTKSKAAATEKPPPKPKSMPKSQYVTVPAGSFAIGAGPDEEGSNDKEKFDSTVTITRPFLMKTTEVTQAEWYFVLGEPSVSYDKTCGLDCAVGYVTWRRALDYLNALSKLEGLEPCYDLKKPLAVWTKGLDCTGYRLPTEAEWEYAARGGTETARYGDLDDIAWHSDNADSKPHPVGKKQKNAFGLFDMLGSQWEWAWDAEDYKPFSGDMSDPIAGGMAQESEGQDRIVRGGSYRDSKLYVRAAHRFQNLANAGDINFGFRPVRTVVEKKK